MTKTKKKRIIETFNELSPENQHTFLMYARVAEAAENSIKKSIKRALNVENEDENGKKTE